MQAIIYFSNASVALKIIKAKLWLFKIKFNSTLFFLNWTGSLLIPYDTIRRRLRWDWLFGQSPNFLPHRLIISRKLNFKLNVEKWTYGSSLVLCVSNRAMGWHREIEMATYCSSWVNLVVYVGWLVERSTKSLLLLHNQ